MICVIVLWSWDIQKHTLRLPRVNHHLLGGTLPTEEWCSHLQPWSATAGEKQQTRQGMSTGDEAGWLKPRKGCCIGRLPCCAHKFSLFRRRLQGFRFFEINQPWLAIRVDVTGSADLWTSLRTAVFHVILRHEVWDHSNPQKNYIRQSIKSYGGFLK